ncbi:TonB-dependent receptor plug domain-containing protein [Geomesophilobacter sediminis]|uniref:TonB-dependent receptor n=1 Tax=Geomesophilobacter sediminis TaxID=2798584 RepID=A0A8J7J2L2_9BACT|nr:TonB-dependent receptor [Geomesophilobacter sediminis]MBJ6725008.1 TonB-dependent receptor [Geomesophilobacter sediminis]
MKFRNRKMQQAGNRLLGDGGSMVKWKYGVPVLLALTALAPALPGGSARAAEADTETALAPAADVPAETAADKAGEATGGNEDLLLFWEQKELYVETATRTAKPISQVAENMEVITAKDIEEMNAHTVNEVLARVSGVFVENETNDFNSPALLHIQGSSQRHVALYLDGVQWNFLSDGHAEAISIPVGIIDRIEIIKGPASSTWGSGLGGVINIITKNVGDFTTPKGMIVGSYGEGRTRDANWQVAGKVGVAKYYLYAGRLASDGLVSHRYSSSDSLYSKVALTPVHNMDLVFTLGYTTPDLSAGSQHSDRFGGVDTSGSLGISNLHATAGMDYHFAPDWALTAEINTLRSNFSQGTEFTKPNALFHVTSGDKYADTQLIDQTFGGNLKLTYSGGNNFAVLGAEATHGTDEFHRLALNRAATLQSTVAVYRQAYVYSELNKWAIFTNDTISLGSFSVTPGIRLDHNSISGTFVSPSVGGTYQPTEHSMVRASVARGFTYPPFSMTSGSDPFSLPNPSLRAEQGWSYQAGAESVVGDRVNLKATVFRHDINNAISDDPDPATLMNKNVGKLVRQGYELAAETVPFFNTSLKVAHSFVHIDPSAPATSRDNYSYLIGIKYDDRKAWLAQVFGSYIWWDMPAAAGPGDYNTFVWDANINRKFSLSETFSLEMFLNLHNIFNSGYTTSISQANTGRWVEGGVKFRF